MVLPVVFVFGTMANSRRGPKSIAFGINLVL